VTGALPGVGGLQDVLKGLAEVIDQLLGTDLLRQIPGTDVQYPSPEYDGLPGPGSASRKFSCYLPGMLTSEAVTTRPAMQ